MSTYEPQYAESIAMSQRFGFARLGLMSNQTWLEDPARLLFVLSRYKFVAKMFQGMPSVLEVGCADGFASRIVSQRVGSLTLSDIDPIFIEDAKSLWIDVNLKRPEFVIHDILSNPMTEKFDGVYALDVLEHISPESEDSFMHNVALSMLPTGSLIIGMPSIESQIYASPRSSAGHINCKSGDEFLAFGRRYFANCHLFSMNDEVVHTGFSKMAHYLFLLCSRSR
jgi:2-polyprenyl-3-methyl-5-hydroxy-6-metoxy-1,4-benzoquinol methylase